MFSFLGKLFPPFRRQTVEPDTSVHASPLLQQRRANSQRGVFPRANWRAFFGLLPYILAPIVAVGLIIWAAMVVPPPWVTKKPINATAVTTLAGLTTPTAMVVTTSPVSHEFLLQTLAAREEVQQGSKTRSAQATRSTSSPTPKADSTHLSPGPWQILLLVVFAVVLLG